MQKTILIIDDEKNILRSLSMILSEADYNVLTAGDIKSASVIIEQENIHFYIVDVILPDGDGIEFIEYIRSRDDKAIIFMISGHASIKMAIEATRKGADDFFEKPLSREKLLITLANFSKRIDLEEKYLRLQEGRGAVDFIGESAVIRTVLAQVDKIAPTNSKVLITGESGTGKEIIAQMIHNKSQRVQKPYVKINCAAIPEQLIEAELFGVEKGAFTGAGERREGKFKQADGGTLFLDEIGDMSLSTQTKVLRVLQGGEFQRVGGMETLSTDVRVIAATNKKLETLVEQGQFREDLFFRLHVMPLHLPALRDRLEDIPLLIDHFLERYSAENNKPGLRISESVKKVLAVHQWPGNVRELKNVIERMVILADGEKIDAGQLPPDFMTQDFSLRKAFDSRRSLVDIREEAEKQYIQYCLDKYDGNVSRAAMALQIDRTYLHRKMRKYDITPDPHRQS